MRNIILFIIIFGLFLDYSSADNTDKSCLGGKYFTDYSTQCNNKVDFELYECRVTNLCDSCNNTDSKKVFDTVSYDDANDHRDDTGIDILKPLHDVQETYKTNMNSIYKCVLIDIQERGLEYLEKVISSTDKTGLIKKELSPKISSEKAKLKSKKSALKCGGLSDDNSTSTLIKKEVLDQVTFEYCKYNFYLLYLQEGYYSYNTNILGIKEEDLSTSEPIEITTITTQSNNINNEINTEIIKIQKVFPLAYYAYSEYEDNYLLHLLLTLIKQDYVLVRDQLSKVLGPINQVAYKIKDAMKNY